MFKATVVTLVATLALLGRDVAAAEIAGQVRDPSGGVVEQARVHLLNVATGAERTALSGAEGRYAFADVRAGIYQLTASAAGFSDASRRITVAATGGDLAQDFALEVGSISATVTVTATRGARDDLMLPPRVESVTREELDAAIPTSTGEAMLSSPGVTAVGSGPFQIRPRLRGLDSSRVLILIDGERLNNARVATDRAGVEVGLVDPSTIEQVEIVSGSGSVMYGTDALSGTINILTHRPGYAPETRVSGGLDGYYSSNENGRRGSGFLGVSGARFAVRVRGSLEEFDDYEAGSPFDESNVALLESGVIRQGDTVDDAFGFDFGAFPDPFNQPYTRTSATVANSHAEGSNVNTAAFFSPRDDQMLQLRWIRRRAENVGFPDFEAPVFFQSITLPYSNLDKVSGSWERQAISDVLASVKVSGYWQRQQRLLFNQGIPIQFPAPTPRRFFPISVFRLDIDSSTEQNVDSFGFDVQGRLLVSADHLLTAGFTYYQDSSSDERLTETQLNLVGEVVLGARGPAPVVLRRPIPLGPPTVANPVRVPDAKFRDFGVFVHDEWDVSSSFRLSAGVRLDRYSVGSEATPGYDVRSLIAGAERSIDPATLPNEAGDSVSRTAFTGNAALLYHPTDRFSFVAHYGRSYRHPNLEELLFAGPATIGNIVPNLRVEPETGDNFDVAAKFRSGAVAASLGYFHNRYHDFISTEIVAEGDAGLLSQAVNFSEVRIQGVEATLEAPFAAGPVNVTLFGNAAWTKGDVLEARNPLTGESLDDTPLDNISPFKAVLGVRVADAQERFWVEYSNRIQSEVDDVAVTLIDSPFLIAQDLFGLEGFTLHRVAAGWDWRQGRAVVGVTAALENLSDEYYREQFQFAPGRGRSFTVGLRLRYD